MQPTNAAARSPATRLTGGLVSGAAHLRRVSRRIARLRGWKRFGVAAAAGGLSVLALAPVFAWPVLFFTLPVLVWLLDGAGPSLRGRRSDQGGDGALSRWWWPRLDRNAAWRAAKDGWSFAFGYFFFGLFWIGEAFLVEAEIFGVLLPFAITVMPGGLALFWGVATAAASLAWSRSATRIIVLAVALSVAEFARGHLFTGFPWNVLGYALTSPLTFMQSAGLLGLDTLSALCVIVFSAPIILFSGPSPVGLSIARRAAVGLAIAGLPLAGLYAYGTVKLSEPPPPSIAGAKVRIVQPSTPQRDKWLSEKQSDIFNAHLRLSRSNPEGRRDDMADISHVIWPEAAMPFLPLSSPRALKMIADLLPPGTQLLSGALRVTQTSEDVDLYNQAPGKRRAYNSLMVFDADGGLSRLYDKIHLVPFGEYLPFQETLEAIGLQQLTRVRGGFTAGPPPRRLLQVDGLPPIAPLICYEAIFPGELFDGDERPGLLLNVTNDGWFGVISGPYQHFHQSRVRAVEEGIPLIRASNNGVSAIIGPRGRVIASLSLNKMGTIDAAVPQVVSPPLYARLRDLIFFGFLACLVSLLLTRRLLRFKHR